MKKKWIALLLAVAMLLGALTACGSAPAAENNTEDTPAPQEETEQPQTGDETEPSDAPAEIPAEALEDPIAAEDKGVTKTELGKMKVAELREKAEELGVEVEGLKKQEIVEALYEALNK